VSRLRRLMKSILGRVPLFVEFWQHIRPASGEIPGGYRLDRLQAELPGWVRSVTRARGEIEPEEAKRILVFGFFSWWVEHGTLFGLWLSALGHEVDFAYLPYRRWTERVGRFDLRRQQAYLKHVLAPVARHMSCYDLLDLPQPDLPAELARSIDEQSATDVQYIRRWEAVDVGEGGEDRDLYLLREGMNLDLARAAYGLMKDKRYDMVMLPNGSILEFGTAYRVVDYLNVPMITYEFGEHRERIWMAQNSKVMMQDTSGLWAARGDSPLSERESQALADLRRARRSGRKWSIFSRQWQTQESRGAQAARSFLGLDPTRPIVLLCTNVVGDSMSLGRQLFTDGMADWLERTVRYFADRPDAQLVVRVHPGEPQLGGFPSEEIVQAALPQMPEHVIVVPPEAKINTYDLVEVANIGLAYTTTVGLEMAMSGIPVVVAGLTHYRGKGFTYDPNTFEEYLAMIDALLAEGLQARLDERQVTLAQRYAYRYFFEYALPFPWHLQHFWQDVAERPLEDQLKPAALERYGRTLRSLLGEPIRWESVEHEVRIAG
jgi:hypothetical protein